MKLKLRIECQKVIRKLKKTGFRGCTFENLDPEIVLYVRRKGFRVCIVDNSKFWIGL